MTNNSLGMTFEERIVSTLKDDKLMALVGDEDAITDLVKRAISETLFKPVVTKDRYGHTTTEDPAGASRRAQGCDRRSAEDFG